MAARPGRGALSAWTHGTPRCARRSTGCSSNEASGRQWFGNCVWDALGIVAMLGGDGVVRTRCPDCEADLVVEVADGALVRPTGTVRFAVPARHWWDDIGFN